MIRPALGVLLIVTCPGALAGQDQSDSAAYRALTQTPLEAFSPVIGAALTTPREVSLSVQARYGLMSFRNDDYIHNVGAGGDLPLAAGRVGVTLGRYRPTCPRDDCPGHTIVSLEFEQRLVGVALGRPEARGSLNVGLKGGLGLGFARDATLVSGLASLPVVLLPRTSSPRLFPFIAPGVGVGLVDDDNDADAGILPTFAVGVGFLALDDRVGMIAGLNRAFLSGGNWLAGISMTWNFGTGGAPRVASVTPQ